MASDSDVSSLNVGADPKPSKADATTGVLLNGRLWENPSRPAVNFLIFCDVIYGVD